MIPATTPSAMTMSQMSWVWLWYGPGMNAISRRIVTTPPMIVPLGKPPCQPHCAAPGMSSGETSEDFATSRELLATAVSSHNNRPRMMGRR